MAGCQHKMPAEQTAGRLKPCTVGLIGCFPCCSACCQQAKQVPVLPTFVLTQPQAAHLHPASLLPAALVPNPYMQVALGDAAVVTGLHVGAKLPLSVSFAVAVAANLVLVLVLLAMLVVARLLNASNNSRLAAAANSPEVGLSSLEGLLARQPQEGLECSGQAAWSQQRQQGASLTHADQTCWPTA